MLPATSVGMPSCLASRMARNQPMIIDSPSITPYEWMGTPCQGTENIPGLGMKPGPRSPISATAPASASNGVVLRGDFGSTFRRRASITAAAIAHTITQMVIWGGRVAGDAPAAGGGRYDPATDRPPPAP